MRTASALALALLSCACGVQQPSQKTTERKASGIITLKCSMQGTITQRNRRGSDVTPIHITEFYHVDPGKNRLESFNKEKSSFENACPAGHKCDVKISPSKIELARQLITDDGMVMVGRVDVDRLSGDIRETAQIDWLTSGRSLLQSTAGSCEISEAPRPKF